MSGQTITLAVCERIAAHVIVLSEGQAAPRYCSACDFSKPRGTRSMEMTAHQYLLLSERALDTVADVMHDAHGGDRQDYREDAALAFARMAEGR